MSDNERLDKLRSAQLALDEVQGAVRSLLSALPVFLARCQELLTLSGLQNLPKG